MKGDRLSRTDGIGRFNGRNRRNASNHDTSSHQRLILIALLLAAFSPNAALANVDGAAPAYDIPLPGNMTDMAQDRPHPPHTTTAGLKLIPDNKPASDRTTVIYSCSQTTDALCSLTSNLKFPEHLASKDAAKTGGEFDVSSYFSVLDHLSMQPGYLLDYVYFFEGIGGEPIIYARKSDVPAYKTYSEYESGRHMASPFGERKSYLEHVVIDGTPDGYFQYALLYLLGGQFYLYWHANYNDQKVVCDISEARKIIESLAGEGIEPIYPETLDSFSQKNFGPVVEYIGDKAVVRLVVFTEWGGFLQKNIAIRRGFPHSVLNETSNVIIPYNSGISF